MRVACSKPFLGSCHNFATPDLLPASILAPDLPRQNTLVLFFFALVLFHLPSSIFLLPYLTRLDSTRLYLYFTQPSYPTLPYPTLLLYIVPPLRNLISSSSSSSSSSSLSSCQLPTLILLLICPSCLPIYEPITARRPLTLAKAQLRAQTVNHIPSPQRLQIHQNLSFNHTRLTTLPTFHPTSFHLNHVLLVSPLMPEHIRLPRAHRTLPALSPTQDR